MSRTRVAAVLAAIALVFPAGCGSDDPGAATATESSAPVARDLASYDAYVLASAENNRLFADVYGIRFTPFAVDRITIDKRVSSLGADEKHVIVAAADEDVDRLAQLTGGGELVPVPGLGRPFAYAPTLRDGVMYFFDSQGDDRKGEFRYFAWDLAKRAKKLTFRSKESVGSAQPMGDGRFLVTTGDEKDLTQLAIRSKSGKLTEYPLGANATELSPGSRFLAATVVATGDQFGDKPEAIALVELKTGKTSRLPGLQLICWNPDGTRLLARRIDAQGESRLVLLDPNKPSAATDVAAVPGLTIYTGTWVRGGTQA